MSFNDTTMDGRTLFAKLADKVARGELIITNFAMELTHDRQYQATMTGQMFTVQSPRTGFNMNVTAVDSEPGRPVPPARVSLPTQVRELIFDEEPVPIYDEDLK